MNHNSKLKEPLMENVPCAAEAKQSSATRRLTSAGMLGALAAATSLTLAPAEAVAEDVPPPPPPPSRVDALFNLEFANEYVTPRGMIVTDQGLTIQPLVLGFFNLYKSDCFINSVTFVPGVWNDFCTAGTSINAPFGSQPKTHWVEIDPIVGMSVGFAKHFTLDVTYTAFNMQILDIGTSQHLDTKLSFDDSEYLKAFALHPYVEFWQELVGKATDADVPEAVFGPSPNSGSHPAPGESFYFEVGVDPSYTFKDVGNLKLEAPCRVLLPNERFYGEYYANASTVGLYELGLKASLPMNFVPPGYGHWSCHAGFRYMHFVDDNLYNLNEFNAPGKPTRDTVQVYGGISIFF
jgi:hypothetical protein